MVRQSAFTLVELSIVLVILGLLVGGVLTGQSLIKAAELRAVSTEYGRYSTAVNTFRDKYFSIPGDMPNATAYWGKDNTNCGGDTGTAATPGACNGNGDGTLNYGSANGRAEYVQFWKHLALAGLIEGTYSGLAGGSGQDDLPGINVPKSKFNPAAWGAHYNPPSFAGSPDWYFAGPYGNYLHIGGTVNSSYADYPAFKPEEAYTLDMKMDDGKPSTGRIFSNISNGTCTNGSSVTDRSATYLLSATGVACALHFLNQF